MDCHSPHRWTERDAPILPNMVGAGQDMTMLKGLPGQLVAPNISPDPETGAGSWTDDQLARAIREGISHDGRALFPMMPYQDFRHMSDEGAWPRSSSICAHCLLCTSRSRLRR